MRSFRLSVACLAALLAGAGASAETAAVTQRSVSDGVALPPTGAALADEATASEVNPGGLGALSAPQLQYLHERDLRLDNVGDGLFFGLRIAGPVEGGLALQWIRQHNAPAKRKTSWSLALGSESLALGVTYNLFSSHESADIEHLTTFDAGLLVRPLRVLSLGLSVRDFDAEYFLGSPLPRRWDLGLGLRPFTDRITFGADLLVDDRSGFQTAQLQFTLLGEPVRGLVLQAGLVTPLHGGEVIGQLGLTLNEDYAGIGYTAGSGAESPSSLDHLIQLRVSGERYRAIPLPRPARYLVLDIDKVLAEPTGGLIQLVSPSHREPYLELLQTLRRLRTDSAISGVLLKVGEMPTLGHAKVEELRAELLALRQAGKRVVAAFMDGGNAEYQLATAAEKIWAVPQATFMVNGYSASATFLAETLNKVGVTVDVARVGAYKNAPDQLTRTDMSPEERQVLNRYLDQLSAGMVEQVAQSRKLAPEKFREVIDRGILSAQAAKDAGLVDGVVYPDELPKLIEELQGGVVDFSYDYPGPPTFPRRWGVGPRIGIVLVDGLISEGKSRSDPLGATRVAGAESIIKALEAAAEDPTVRAVVVRVDSSGGSGSASDLIWRAVIKLRERKPVVVSMGDYAASGGYYVAMAGDEVLAEPTTLTGSIGVFAIKPNVGPLLEKIGAKRVVLKRGDKADLLSLDHPWSPEEQKAMQRYVDEFYDVFITKVAESRKLDKAKVDALAQGRVHSGADAKDLGLVDALGGLDDAIERAKARASLAGSDVDVALIRPESGAMNLEFASAEGDESLARISKLLGRPFDLALLEMADRPLALLPWRLEIR